MAHDRIAPFRGRYFFLSNFYRTPVMYEGVLYPSAEHAFQAAKSVSPSVRAMIAGAPSEGGAKRLGKTIVCRPDWEAIKLTVMETILLDKFTRHADLRAQLLETGEAELVEENTWGDQYWGVSHGRGANHLGRLLMRVRTALRRAPA